MRSIERQDGVQEDEATKHGPIYESLLPERGHSAAVRLHRGRGVLLDEYRQGIETQHGPDARNGLIGDTARRAVRLGRPGRLGLVDLHDRDGTDGHKGQDSNDHQRHPPTNVEGIDDSPDESRPELNAFAKLPSESPPDLVCGSSHRAGQTRYVVHVEEGGVLPQEGGEPLLPEGERRPSRRHLHAGRLDRRHDESIRAYNEELERYVADAGHATGRTAEVAEGVREQVGQYGIDQTIENSGEAADREQCPGARRFEEGEELRERGHGKLLLLLLLLVLAVGLGLGFAVSLVTALAVVAGHGGNALGRCAFHARPVPVVASSDCRRPRKDVAGMQSPRWLSLKLSAVRGGRGSGPLLAVHSHDRPTDSVHFSTTIATAERRTVE